MTSVAHQLRQISSHNAGAKLDRLLFFVSAAVMKISFTTTHFPRTFVSATFMVGILSVNKLTRLSEMGWPPQVCHLFREVFIWYKEFNAHGSKQFLDYSEGILEGRVEFLSKNGRKIKRNYYTREDTESSMRIRHGRHRPACPTSGLSKFLT
jgi:hypothetical protein